MNWMLIDECEQLYVVEFVLGMNCVACMLRQLEILMISPRRVVSAWAKMTENHPWCCVRSRLGELMSP